MFEVVATMAKLLGIGLIAFNLFAVVLSRSSDITIRRRVVSIQK